MNAGHQAALLCIPGIGGHPAFHPTLLQALREAGGSLHTGSHGDFAGVPFGRLQQHVEHWAGVAGGIRSQALVLVGVSFGAHVALELTRQLPARVRGCILISWWPVGRPERTALRALAALPRATTAALLGRALFRWSEHTADDRAALLQLRRALYDDEHSVHARLLARLLCCSAAAPPPLPGPPGGVHGIWGVRELARWRALSGGARRTLFSQVHVVSGTHAIATSASPALETLVAALARRMAVDNGGAMPEDT